MKWFLNLLERIGRKRIVMDRESDEPYLERYYLFLKDRDRFPFNIFLHKFLKGDPFTAKSLRALEEYLEDAISPLSQSLSTFEKDVATGTSKTFRTLAKIAITLYPKFGPHLTYSALEAMVPKLQSLDIEGRRAMQSISAERAPQIVAGAMVAKELMKTLDLQEIQICPWALREGIVLHRLDWIER
jgi:exopolyphosphatase/guanosine-5'-triphosphate,3'-diphosphate pyrophosphatase